MEPEQDDTDIFYDAIDDQVVSLCPQTAANPFPQSAPTLSPRPSLSQPLSPARLSLPLPARSIPMSCHNKPVKEFSCLSLVQEIQVSSGTETAIWVARFSPSARYLAVTGQDPTIWLYAAADSEGSTVLESKPYRSYVGHTKPVVDLAWASSSSYFLSSSMDKCVILWQLDSSFQLHCFSHPDIVSSVCFSPSSDDFFLSGCFDRMIRIWNVREDRVEACYQTTDLVTALAVNAEAGLTAVGLRNGVCMIYETVQGGKLRFNGQVDCRNRKGRKASGRKVTGIAFFEDAILVTTNDSRMRLINLQNFSTRQKYKGARNEHAPIRASFSSSFAHVISGSDTGQVYIWNVYSAHVPLVKSE